MKAPNPRSKYLPRDKQPAAAQPSVEPEPPVVEQVPPSDIRQLTIFHSVPRDFMGISVVAMQDASGEVFLVPEDRVDRSHKGAQPVDVLTVARPYDWKAELEQLVPDVETVRRIMLESFWRAGAFDKSALENSIRRTMFDHAFPFRRQFDAKF